MSATLAMACACGKSEAVDSPTVGDIPDAMGMFGDFGFDYRGFVRCRECLAAGVDMPAEPAQIIDLFSHSSGGSSSQTDMAGALPPPEVPAAQSSEAA